MKVLLFSCSTGGGHNSAAAALAQELEARSVKNRTYDALQFLPKSTADLISHGHDFAYRYAPKIYGAGYRREEKHPSSLFYEQSIRGIGPLYEELIDQAPDAVICVHLFPAMMMTELRCSYGVRIPTYFVATDFTCSPGVGDLQVDGLCIPHRDLIPEFVTAGLPQERLFPTGIPVGRQFLHPESREEARRALDLPVDGRILTLACGSMGAGPLRTTAQKVAELMGPEDLLVTICGSNHRMYQQMQSDFFRPVDRVRVLGYTHEMFRYMYASDLLLTKAGGLTTAEAVAAVPQRRPRLREPQHRLHDPPRLCAGGQQRRGAPAHAAGHPLRGHRPPEHGGPSGGLPYRIRCRRLRSGPAPRRCVKSQQNETPQAVPAGSFLASGARGRIRGTGEVCIWRVFSAYRPASAPRFGDDIGQHGSQLRGPSEALHRSPPHRLRRRSAPRWGSRRGGPCQGSGRRCR